MQETDTVAKPKTNVEIVTANFAASIAAGKMGHELAWISGRYDALARARLQDEVIQRLGKPIEQASEDERYAIGLTLLQRVLSASRTISNHSSGLGDNAMREATLSAEADMAQECLFGKLAELEEAAWKVARPQMLTRTEALAQARARTAPGAAPAA